MNDVTWMSPWRGIEVLFNIANLSLGLAIFFLARTLASLYFMNNIKHDIIYERSKKQVLYNSVPFVVLLLVFLAIIFSGKGYTIMEDGGIQLVPFKYFHNLLEMPLNTLILLIGVVGVLFGIIKSILKPHWRKGIWFSGIGIVLAVIALFIVAGFNNTAFYPSYTDINSSLTIYNALCICLYILCMESHEQKTDRHSRRERRSSCLLNKNKISKYVKRAKNSPFYI